MRMTVMVFAVLIAASVAVSSCNDQEETSYRIAFNVLENADKDDYEVYVMNQDGSGVKNITNHPDIAWVYYAWEDKLYFISDRDTCSRCYFLYEMNADGQGVRKVTEIQLEDSWMGGRLNGRELVVSGRIGTELRHQLFLIDVATGDYQQLTHDTTALHRDPLFTPDGRQIVFVFRKNRKASRPHEELWIMEADGKHPRQLTRYPPSDTSAAGHAYYAGAPRWHHGEGYITYPSRQQGKYSLYAISPDGKMGGRLTDLSQNELWHDWSPDGKWLAVELFDRPADPSDLYVMNWKTKELFRLTHTVDSEHGPVFVEAPVK